MKEFLRKITVLPCKQPHLFYLVYPGKIELVKISTISRSLQIVNEYFLDESYTFMYPMYFSLCKAYLIGLTYPCQNNER